MGYYRKTIRPRLKRFARVIARRMQPPPDFDDSMRRILAAVGEYTMTSPERVHALVTAVRYVVKNGIDGDFVECGVWRGGSSMAVALALQELGDDGRHLYLYDTFEGMTEPTAADVALDGKSAQATFASRRESETSSDWCRSSLDEVRANLARTGYPADKVHFVQGRIEETLPRELPARPLSILRLDTDWYESTRHELLHLYPCLVPRGVLLIDDYGHWAGARRAVDEYIAEHNLCLLLNRIDYTGRIAIKP